MAEARNDDDGERKALIDLYGKALESFDKLIVTISGGALVLSITLLEKISPPAPLVRNFFPLWLGWLALALSLCIIVVSMLTGHKAIEDALRGKDLTRFTGLTTWLNALAAVAMIIGLLALARYAQSNLSSV